MRWQHLSRTLTVAVALAVPGWAAADDVNDAFVAYTQRNFEEARTKFRAAATEGDSPVAQIYLGFMYYEGLWRLLQAGVTLPRMHQADPQRVALEAYPGLLAHQLIGWRSYKNQDSPDRLVARKDLLERLEQGQAWGMRLKMSHAQRDTLAHEVSADRLDAVLCLMQTAWAVCQPDFGLPADVDPVEGWILTA